MCVQIVERFARCGCLYFEHSVDPCSAINTLGHEIQVKEVPIYYTCPQHRFPLLEFIIPYKSNQEAQIVHGQPLHRDESDSACNGDVHATLSPSFEPNDNVEHTLLLDDQVKTNKSGLTEDSRQTPWQEDSHLTAATCDRDSGSFTPHPTDQTSHEPLHPGSPHEDVQKHSAVNEEAPFGMKISSS